MEMAVNESGWVLLMATLLYRKRVRKMKKLKSCIENRNYIGAAVLAIFLAFLQVLGYSFSKENSWNMWVDNVAGFVVSVCFITCIFFVIILKIWNLLDSAKERAIGVEISKKKIIFILSIIFFLCWLPYLIIFYPCSINADVVDQLGQFFHIDSMCWTQKYVNLENPEMSLWNNHHPVFHTFILGTFAQIGKAIGSIEVGLFLLVIVQALAMALTFSYMINYLIEEKVSLKICFGIVLFFAFWPLHGITATTLCKDTLFNVIILYNTIQLLKIFKTPERMLKKTRLIINIICFILMGLLRNNGLYLLIFIFPVMLMILREYKKKILILLGIPILFLGLIMPKIIFPMFHIAPGSEREMLSIPFQQIARVLKERPVEAEDIKIIENALAGDGGDYHDIVNRYDPRYADNVKNRYNINLSSGEKKQFLKVWIKYLIKYPGVYIQAAINNEYLYIYYEREVGNNTAYLYYNGISIGDRDIFGIENYKKFSNVRNQIYTTLTKVQKNIWTGWIFNIGFYMCLFIIFAVKSLVNKSYKVFWGFGLIIGNILINFLGPIVYMRYAYYFIVAIPLYMGILTIDNKEKRGGYIYGKNCNIDSLL